MGAFYANITVATADTDAVVQSIRDLERDAYVAPAENGFTVVYDSEEQSERDTILLLETLTKRFDCAAIAVCIADDDIMFYLLADRGRILEEYNSNPDYDGSGEAPPSGGDARLLCAAFRVPEREADVHRILHTFDSMFESQRHMLLAREMGLPAMTVSLGYTYIAQGEAPAELAPKLVAIGPAPPPR